MAQKTIRQTKEQHFRKTPTFIHQTQKLWKKSQLIVSFRKESVEGTDSYSISATAIAS